MKRSRLRLLCGRLWYTLLRYALWYFGGIRFARRRPAPECRCLHFAHRTPLLRKLRAVDMRYQHNKIVNLRIAAARLDGVVLRPGETLSYWRLIGRRDARAISTVSCSSAARSARVSGAGCASSRTCSSG